MFNLKNHELPSSPSRRIQITEEQTQHPQNILVRAGMTKSGHLDEWIPKLQNKANNSIMEENLTQRIDIKKMQQRTTE